MKRAVIATFALGCGMVAAAAVFERYLSPDKPADRAILAYHELAKTGKASSRDLAELGVLLLAKGFPDDAERFLRDALKVDPDNFEAAYRLGLVLQRMGRDKDAVRFYRSVVQQRPGHAYARFMLALAEERSGRRHAAIDDYAKAYRFMPELSDPAKNPLVLDSRLQDLAQLRHYREAQLAATLKVDAIDPEAVHRMMEVRPPEATPPPPSAAAPAAPPAGALPTPAKTAPAATSPGKPTAAPATKPAPATAPPAGPKKARDGAAGAHPAEGGGVPLPGLPNVSGTAPMRSLGDASPRLS